MKKKPVTGHALRHARTRPCKTDSWTAPPAPEDRWDCSRESLKRFEKRRILRPLKIGAKVKYRLSDIVEAEKEAEVVA